MNRRKFMARAGLSGLGLGAFGFTAAGQHPEGPDSAIAKSAKNGFPTGFFWGTATAAYQVEGAVKEDGRGESIWDPFVRIPGKIKNGDNADVAVDMYHRYKEDVKHMRDIGCNSYRFSVSWPRIFPEGSGQPNMKGLDFYKRLVDELLANGVTPFMTLYHWDLPLKLQQQVRGWQSKQTSLYFADYAAFMARSLGDRVKHFFTLNEMFTFVEWGYGGTLLAPGLGLDKKALNQVRHHVVLAHGLGLQAIRANAPKDVKVGPAENVTNAVPALGTAEHVKAAEIAMRELNAGYLTVILEGKYTDRFLKNEGADAPVFTAEELKIIGAPVDFAGINVYMPSHYVLASDNEDGYEKLPFTAIHPKMASPWHYMGPEALYWTPRHMRNIWKVPEIYITENGCGAADQLTADGRVLDTDRIMFLRNYLSNLQLAIAEGVPVKGYFHWSLMDNFEWAGGFGTRFGLLHVDYKTLRRTPKLSAQYYAEVIRQGRVV